MRHQRPKQLISLLLVALTLFSFGCRNVYYATWEKLGKQKRDLLKDQVAEVRQEEKEAAEQFKDALTRLKELYHFEGGKLETLYNRLKSEYDASSKKAEAVRARIRKVDQIASDLFAEWTKENESISNPKLRASSREKLNLTKERFAKLYAALVRAEKSMEPVLTQFRDQVMYLKHNLNAQAIAALKGESVDIETEITRLISEMNASISEADSFIKAMQTEASEPVER